MEQKIDKVSGNLEYKQATDSAMEIIKAEITRRMVMGASPEEIYMFLRDETDDVTSHPNYQSGISCGKTEGDCSFCCHETILLGKIEAHHITKVVFERGIKPNMERVQEQMSNPNIKWMQKACPLLSEPNEAGKRTCTIYDERPLICRTHNSNEDPINCDRSTDPNKFVNETRASVIDAIQLVAVLVGMDQHKPYTSVHELMFHMFATGDQKEEIIKREQQMCTLCKKPHFLRDEDAGSAREMMRVCVPCLEKLRKNKQP
jgi:Fe-S-cluster containining protein